MMPLLYQLSYAAWKGASAWLSRWGPRPGADFLNAILARVILPGDTALLARVTYPARR